MRHTLRQRLAPTLAFALAFALALAAPASALAASSPPIAPPAGLLMTVDGHVLWTRNATQTRHVASTIKMLNALVVRDHTKLTDVITVTAKSQISNGGVGLRAGQKLTVEQLLNIMLVHSANDAAMALGVGVGGSEAKFVAMMNAKAKALGLDQTHAIDPNGLSGRETSSAHDLAVLGQHILDDPVLAQIVRKKRVLVPRPNGTTVSYRSSDLMLGRYAGLEGIKTGFTREAGWCYVGAAKRGDVELIGVVLGTPTQASRFSTMRALLDWGFHNTHVIRVVAVDEAHTATIDGRQETLWTGGSARAAVFGPGSRVSYSVTTSDAERIADGRVATLIASQDGYQLARVGLFSHKGDRPSAGGLRGSRGGGASWGVWVIVALGVAGVGGGAWWFARSAATAKPRHRPPVR